MADAGNANVDAVEGMNFDNGDDGAGASNSGEQSEQGGAVSSQPSRARSTSTVNAQNTQSEHAARWELVEPWRPGKGQNFVIKGFVQWACRFEGRTGVGLWQLGQRLEIRRACREAADKMYAYTI